MGIFDLRKYLAENKLLKEEKMKGRFFKDDNYYTYDHLLPKGIGDDFTSAHGKVMMKAAKEDLKELKSNNKNGVIKKDNMNLPYLQIIQEEVKSLKEGGWGETNVEAQQIFDLILDELDGISPGVTLNIKITDIGDWLYNITFDRY